MPLFEILSEDEIESIISKLPDVGPNACRLVNASLSVLFANSDDALCVIAAVSSDDVKVSREINGLDLLQTMRFVSAAIYGPFVPLILERWGIKDDMMVREIATRIILMSSATIKKKALLDKKYYSGKRIMQPVEDLETIEIFEQFLMKEFLPSFL